MSAMMCTSPCSVVRYAAPSTNELKPETRHRKPETGNRKPLTDSMDATIQDFEAAIAELETIVKKLEEGDLPLQTSLQLYERGVHLSPFCHARLEAAERRIEILNERGELKPAPSTFADESSRD